MRKPRSLELDVLRGLAVTLVLGVHVPAYPIWSQIGGIGVDLFFVLSGFLISTLLFVEYRQTQKIRLARFFGRRVLKLYPSFYLMLGASLTYCIFWHFRFNTRQLLGELFLCQNYIGQLWGHTWSLAVEEHFYIFLPLLLTLLMRANRGAKDPFWLIPYIALIIAIVCLSLRLWTSHRFPGDLRLIHYEPSHLRFDGLFTGVLIGYLYNFHSDILAAIMNSSWRLPFSFLGVIALSPMLIFPGNLEFAYTVGFTFTTIGFAVVLLLALFPDRKFHPLTGKPSMAARGFAFMGRYSYTIYLWHVPLAMMSAWIETETRMNQYLLHALYCAASVGVGVGASKLLEQPVLRLRERLLPNLAPPPRVLTPENVPAF